jgi:uncharacterized membrane protein
MKKSKQKTTLQPKKRSNISSAPLPRNEEPKAELPSEIFENLPDAIKDDIKSGELRIGISKTSVSSFRSNFPPVEFFYAFEEKFPGWGVRLMEMTERQGLHRQENEKRQIEGSEKRMDHGQKFGFSIAAISLFVSGAILIFAPQSWASSLAALGITIAGVGGPAVARILAAKFDWPSMNQDKK